MLGNSEWTILAMFSTNVMLVSILESNEVNVMAILEAPQISISNFHNDLVVESDMMNAISWVSSSAASLGSSPFYFNEINFSLSVLMKLRLCLLLIKWSSTCRAVN